MGCRYEVGGMVHRLFSAALDGESVEPSTDFHRLPGNPHARAKKSRWRVSPTFTDFDFASDKESVVFGVPKNTEHRLYGSRARTGAVTITEQIRLSEAARTAVAEGWEPWELPEYVKAAARSLGVRLTADDVAAVLRDAGQQTT
jgi:hypothetical protein